MSKESKFDADGLCMPGCFAAGAALPDAYLRQYEEARVINEFFTKTPVQMLADDVGMGKTWVAMMTLFSRLNRNSSENSRGQRHAVVIAPTRLVANKWVYELNYFNQNFVKDSEINAIIHHDSLSDLLTDVQHCARNRFPEQNKPLNELLRNRLPQTKCAEIFLLELIKATRRIAPKKKWPGTDEDKKLIDSFASSLEKMRRYPAMSAALSQNKIEKLISNLKLYASAFKSQGGKWFDCEFDRTVWAKRRKRVHWTTWAKDLVKLSSENAGLKQILHLVQIASVLWDADLRRSVRPKNAVLTQETAEKLHQKFYHAGDDNALLQWIKIILRQGLSKLDNASDILKNLGETECDVNFVIPVPEAERIVLMLAAYADRLKEISGHDIKIDDARMHMYAAAGVFRHPTHLHDAIDELKRHGNPCERLSTFLAPILSMTTQNSRMSKERPNKRKILLDRLAQGILQLVDYEVNPNQVGSFFWEEEPKQHAIHVICMNDLKKGEAVSQGSPRNNLRTISLAIVDEAHNWRRRSHGAERYQKLVAPLVERTLLVTATPLHMGVEDLKSIIDITLGLDKKQCATLPEDVSGYLRAEYFLDFINSYQAIFCKDKNRLQEAAQKQKAVVEAIHNLSSMKQDAEKILEKARRELPSPSTGEKFKQAQLDAWTESLLPDPYLHELAESVLDLHTLLNQDLLKNISLFINKTRAPRYYESTSIARRRYLCGQEADVAALESDLNPPADDAHLLLHDFVGIDNSATDWVNLIGMRLSQLASQNKNAFLLTALPSSYEALKSSAALSSLKIKAQDKGKDEAEDQKTDNIALRYFHVLDKCLSSAEPKNGECGKLMTNHPKVKRTVEIAFKNLLLGQKTLVFCQRLDTVDVILKALNNRCSEFLGSYPDTQRYDADHPLDWAFCVAREFTVQQMRKFPKSKSHINFDALQSFLDSRSPDQNLAASDFDARAVWLVSTALIAAYMKNNLKRRDKEKLLSEISKLVASQKIPDEELLPDDENETEAAKAAAAQDDAISGRTLANFKAVVAITGRSNRDPVQRGRILRNFSAPFFPLVLICGQVSQEGVDMHRYCRTLILHDLNWNPAIIEQRIGRLDRIASFASELKQPMPVDIFVPFLADSYDEYQFSRVLQRADLQELVFGRNDKVVSDSERIRRANQAKQTENKANDDREDEVENEMQEFEEMKSDGADGDFPLLGPLIHGFFDMDLSAAQRRKIWFSEADASR